ncbi:farnesyl pyrophosphate synthase [Oxyura jamaicensis]|uniref:farnesyl pyrophosphate synthase n=1 Tax=Oxyura jamaicensis TaxID=8884 RepID=UPI0015A55A21|nr:farnesyl pyrophosphate synthase [Oxyura jamaicensis]
MERANECRRQARPPAGSSSSSRGTPGVVVRPLCGSRCSPGSGLRAPASPAPGAGAEPPRRSRGRAEERGRGVRCGQGAMSGDGARRAAGAEREEFVGFFPQVVRDLTGDGLGHPEVGDAVARLKEVLEYNAPGGKYNRGLTVLAAFRELAGPQQQDPESLQCALAVGWCIELFQAFFLVADDIMDQSLTRRGQLCWYKKEGIGLDAINDAFLLESSVYRMLKKYCGERPYYLHLLELFLQTAYQTELGQMLDLITAPVTQVDLNRFSEQRYKAIVKYKTAFYSFYLPVAAAMYMTGIDSKEEHDNAKAILLEMGEFFQIQDDYLDCFGDPALTGKVGTDIQDNKCSWLVVECLRRVTPDQRQILEENYGHKEPEKVAKVKELYETLGMKAAFHEYEEKSYQRLQELIRKHANRLPKEIFLGLAQKIYKRQK